MTSEKILRQVLDSYVERLAPVFQDEAKGLFASLPADILVALSGAGYEIKLRQLPTGFRKHG